MDQIKFLIDLFLHLDGYLENIITTYGAWTYGLLFFVIFMETGFVVTPFLPGDSLLFAAGAFAAKGSLNVWLVIVLTMVAAIIGDTVNYWIGHSMGNRAYNVKWIKKEYLDRTHAFFEKHGGKTIFLARFVPIVRTFAPFVAGMGRMSYSYFFSYNVFGGIVWVLLFTYGVVYAVIFCSITVITGMGGLLSLSQATFAAIGEFAYFGAEPRSAPRLRIAKAAASPRPRR